MARVQALRFEPENGRFLAPADGSTGHPIACFFYADGVLTLAGLQGADGSQEFLPLDLIRLSPHHGLFLLPFASLTEAGLFTIWFLNSQHGYMEQHVVSAGDVATLYRLAGASPAAPAWLLDFPAALKSGYLHALVQLDELCRKPAAAGSGNDSELADPAMAPESNAFFTALIQRLTPADLTTALLTQLREDPGSVQDCDVPQLLAMWEFSCQRAVFEAGHSEYADAVIREHRYSLLKELHLLQTGRDLVFNPFLGRHQPGGQATFLPSNERSSAPFSVNKAVLFRHGDVDLVEFRGPGFSMMVSGYQIGAERFCVTSPAVTSWLPKDYARYVARHAPLISQASQRPESADRDVHLVNLSLVTNLGHTLWNDISGYYLAQELLQAFPALKRGVKIRSFQRGGTAFSSQSYNEFFHPHILPQLAKLDIEVVSDFMSLADLSRPMTLHGMVVPAEIAEAMQSHYAGASEESDTIRILINLRAHNKSLLNTPECLQHWLSLPEVQPLKARLFFTLELHESATSMCDEILAVLDQHGLHHERLVNCSLDQLCHRIASAAVVIAPVGSALVLPTWIWNRDCVAHGDPLHMQQLNFWPAVSPYFPDQRQRLHAIPDEGIHAEGMEIYSNYRVEPQAFAEQVQAALARTLGH